MLGWPSARHLLADDGYPVDVIVVGGNTVCQWYTPNYTAWCHVPSPMLDPAKPSNLTAFATAPGQGSLAWQDNSQNCQCEGATCPAPLPSWQWFDIERRDSSSSSFEWIAAVAGTTTSFVDASVVWAWPPPTYRIMARPKYGISAASNDVTVGSSAPGPGPSAPCCLTAYLAPPQTPCPSSG